MMPDDGRSVAADRQAFPLAKYQYTCRANRNQQKADKHLWTSAMSERQSMATSFTSREPLVHTKVRLFAQRLPIAWQKKSGDPTPVYEGQSVLIEGTPWQQVAAALRARRIRKLLPMSNDISLFVNQMTASGPTVRMTWQMDIQIDEGGAHAQVHSTRPRLDLEPVPVEPFDNVLSVTTKLLEAANARNLNF